MLPQYLAGVEKIKTYLHYLILISYSCAAVCTRGVAVHTHSAADFGGTCTMKNTSGPRVGAGTPQLDSNIWVCLKIVYPIVPNG